MFFLEYGVEYFVVNVGIVCCCVWYDIFWCWDDGNVQVIVDWWDFFYWGIDLVIGFGYMCEFVDDWSVFIVF